MAITQCIRKQNTLKLPFFSIWNYPFGMIQPNVCMKNWFALSQILMKKNSHENLEETITV